MKAPRYFRITIDGSTDQARRQLDHHHLEYLLDRLVSGEDVAEGALLAWGLFVEVGEHEHRWIDVGTVDQELLQERCAICSEEREVSRSL